MKNLAYTISFFLVLSIALTTTVLGQNIVAKQDTNGITVVQDKRLPKLLDTYIETQPEGVPGYRVQVFFTDKKAVALDIKTSFKEKFRDYDAKVDYAEPYYKVLAGAFRTKLQAEKLLNMVKGAFPGSFVVNSNISLEKLRGEDN